MKVEFFNTAAEADYKNATSRSMKRFLWGIAVFSVIFILLGAIGIVFAEDEADSAAGIPLIVLGVLMPILYVLTVKILSRRQVLTNKTYFGGTTRYIFTDDEFSYETKNDLSETRFSGKYSCIFKAVEYKEVLMIYVSASSMLTVGKSGLTEGTLEELRDKLTLILKDKFRIKLK